MSKEDVLICDRCDSVVRGVMKPSGSKPELVVHARGDLSILNAAMGADTPSDDPTSVSSRVLEDLCDECRDEISDLVAKIFKR